MTTTWVVVAHQTGARIMEHRPGYGHHLTLAQELENPDGRKKDGELDSDRGGSTFTGTRRSGGRRAMHRRVSSHEQLVESFARAIALQLEHARSAGRFQELILVAEPHFLGLLRAALDAPTAHMVVSSVTKDLAAVPPAHVAQHIADVLPL